MAIAALDHWEQSPRIESMRRPNMRADESKNPAKFGKARQSLDRLQQHVEMAATPEVAELAISLYRNRLSRALQLSTARLRIAPGTTELHEEHAHAIALSGAEYEKKRQRESVREVSGMTIDDAREIRRAVRHEIIERKLLALGRLVIDDSERQLQEAEDFTETLDEKWPTHAFEHQPELHVPQQIDSTLYDDSDERLAAAEALTAYWDDTYGSIPPRASEGRTNAKRVYHWWETAGDIPAEFEID